MAIPWPEPDNNDANYQQEIMLFDLKQVVIESGKYKVTTTVAFSSLIKKYTRLFWPLLFIPLIGTAGPQHETTEQETKQAVTQVSQASVTLPELIYDSSEHFSDIESANLDGLLKRIGDSRLVLLGEASHGTAEFYEMRARITRELIEKKGFTIIALEADWPDEQASII